MAKTKSPVKRLSEVGLTPQKGNSKGLYGKLGNKSIPVPNRLKLLCYAWKTQQVNLANKHQTLLHWFTNALHTKSQIKDEDKPTVWECLHEVLKTVDLLKETLYFKPSFTQVILDEFGKIHEGKSKSRGLAVVNCCRIILITPGLDRLFLSQYETLIQLVAAVTQISTKPFGDDELDSNCEDLFNLVVKLFASNQMMKTNATQNLQQFTTKLLPAVLALVHANQTRSDHFVSSVAALKDVSFQILCARDLLQYYESFLRLKTPFNESVYSPPKFIEAVYLQLTKALALPDQQKGSLPFIPEFLEAFVTAYRPGENPVGFYHFVYLTDLLDIEKHPDALDALRDLLKVVQGQSIYNVSADIESGDKHIEWFKELAKKLIDIHPQHRNDASWYECFDWLLRISHSSVEGKVSALLTACLKSSQRNISPECKHAQNELLCRIASVYGQLRQPNKLLIAIFNSLEQISDANFTWPSELVTALLGTLCCPPLTSVVQLWQNVLNRVKEMSSEKVCFRLAIQLLSEFLMTMPLTDPSLTPIVVKKVMELMNETKENVIVLLLNQFKEFEDNMKCSTLHLVLSWEKVIFLLCQTANVRPTLIEVSSISKSVKRNECETLQYLWKLLLLGRLRAETLFSFQNPESKLWNCAKFMSSALSTPEENTTSWNLQILEVNKNTCSTAKWDLILGHLSLIIDSLDQTHLSSISNFLCDAMNNMDDEKIDGKDTDGQDLALKFLRSPEFHEMTKLHGTLLSSLWLRIGDSLTDNQTPKKKRKSGHFNVFMKLSEVASKTSSYDSDELTEALENICEEMSTIKYTSFRSESADALKKYLEFGIRNLPLEYLKPPDLLSCAVGVIGLMGQAHSSDVTPCVKILLRLIENLQFPKVLEFMNSSSIVQMFIPLFEAKIEGFKPLMSKFCRQICDSQGSIEQLEPIVGKLCQDVSKIKLSSSYVANAVCFGVLLKSFAKACNRNSPEKVKKLCKAYVLTMSPFAENLVKKCIAEGQKCAELCMETMATMIMIRKTKELKECTSSDGIIEVLPDICQISVEYLKSTGYSNTCADFIDTLCDNKKLLEITDDYLSEVLSALVGYLVRNEGSTHIESALDLIVIVLVAKSDIEKTFQDMLDNLIPKLDDRWMSLATVTLKIWQHISVNELPQSIMESFIASSQQLMPKVQEMLLASKEFPQNAAVWNLQSTALQTENVLLSNYGGTFRKQCIVLAFHGCQYVDLDVEIKPALDLMSSVFGILNSLLLSYPHIVFNCIPTFLSTTGYLLRSLVGHSQQSSVSAEDLEPLLNCAQDIDRLFSLIKTNQTDFGRVVPYLIAEYVQGLQNGTVHPEIKKCLSLAVHKLISICDVHSISLLHTTIPPGQRDIFGSLHQEYKKYYKYYGKV